MNTKRLLASSLVPAGLLAGSAAAMPAGTNNVDLNTVLDRMNTLEQEVGRLRGVEAELARLRAAQGSDAIDAAREAELRGLVAEALADADTRSSLLQSGGVAGWDGGFSLGSADGNYALNISGLMQVRYVHSLRDNSADDSVGGFENQRTYLTFAGHIVDPSWMYKIQAGVEQGVGAGAAGTFTLLDAYIGKDLGDGLALMAGQMKVPMLREAGMDEKGVQGTGRSLFSAEFDPQRTQGVALAYAADNWKFVGALTDGHDATGGSNTPWNTYDVEYSITLRGEYLVSGTWGQFADMTSSRGAEQGIMIGGAFHHQVGEYGTTATETDATQWTIDASAEFDGANVFVAYVDRDATGTALDGSGFMAQGGYYFTDDLEGFARYEYLENEVDADSLSIITVGVNKYFAGNNAKFSADLGYALDGVSAFWSGGTLGAGGILNGWQQDAANEDGQMVVRAQFQLAF
ncbi:MAG: hypothetical protein ACYTEV_07725 [Planctomycetota bacterium]